MEIRILQPEQIIVPGEYELGNRSILNIYFRIFDKGHGDDLPPVIIIKPGQLTTIQEKLERYYQTFEKCIHFKADVIARRNDYQTFFRMLEKDPYLLIDGNHRTAAATLTHNPISGLEIQTDKDFEEIERMIERGEIFNFNRPEKSLDQLRESYIAFCLGLSNDRIPPNSIIMGIQSTLKYTKTVKERINELISNGDLPKYMKERYLNGK